MKFVLLLLFQALTISAIIAQETREPEGGSAYQPQPSDEITPEQRATIIKKLQANEKALRTNGSLKTSERPAATLFQWPLKQAPGFSDNGFYTISNYVDENPAYPNLVLDYN